MLNVYLFLNVHHAFRKLTMCIPNKVKRVLKNYCVKSFLYFFYLFSDLGYSSGFPFFLCTLLFYISFVINGICFFNTVHIFLIYTELFIMSHFLKIHTKNSFINTHWRLLNNIWTIFLYIHWTFSNKVLGSISKDKQVVTI